MNILIIGASGRITSYKKEHLAQIKKVLPTAKVDLIDPSTGKFNDSLKEAEILITSPVGFDLDLSDAKKLKWLHSSSAGVSALAKLLKGYDVILTNSSGVHPIPIAEHVFGLILMFSRRLYRAYRFQIENKEWIRDVETLDAYELSGKSLGIIGYGRIGARIAKIAKGFEMEVVALKHRKEIVDPNVDRVLSSIVEVLRGSDFVVNCLPLTDETFHYFDMKKFQQMKAASYYINIGRGQTVVEMDLINALKQGVIAGAGLDVFETEPLPASSPLWGLDNVIISPHYSGWTPKYADRVIEIFCKNLKAYLANKPMPNLVDKERGY